MFMLGIEESIHSEFAAGSYGSDDNDDDADEYGEC